MRGSKKARAPLGGTAAEDRGAKIAFGDDQWATGPRVEIERKRRDLGLGLHAPQGGKRAERACADPAAELSDTVRGQSDCRIEPRRGGMRKTRRVAIKKENVREKRRGCQGQPERPGGEERSQIVT